MITALLVVVCGGAGAVARFAIDGFVSDRVPSSFPFGTLIVNLSGSFVLGLLAGLDADHQTSVLLGTATIGSYTTFSTWMLESHRAAQDGDGRQAWVSIALALATGLAAAALGRSLGRWL